LIDLIDMRKKGKGGKMEKKERYEYGLVHG